MKLQSSRKFILFLTFPHVLNCLGESQKLQILYRADHRLDHICPEYGHPGTINLHGPEYDQPGIIL